uniref:eIF-4F 25 kDa subunit n=1 Tax=Timema californicum TaxID=61474 RepID=A0A7R9P5B7_TIMCA|nr:unnamed protein product [Timema californicum]
MEDLESKDDGVIDNVDSESVSGVPQPYIKHPLQNMWTLWYYENDRNKNWEENQREVTSFDTVEDFWSLFHHIKQASELKQGCDYSLFKKGILPMWEDDANKRGGRWLINLEKKHRGHDLNNYWLEVLLCLIGEAFDDYHEDVCGAVVNIRAKGDKIGIWTSDALKSQSVVEIGKYHSKAEKIVTGQTYTLNRKVIEFANNALKKVSFKIHKQYHYL